MLPSQNTQTRLHNLTTEAELNKLKGESTDKPILILFWASWDEPSSLLKSMLEEMPTVYKSVNFASVDCDESELVDTLNVDSLQSIVILHPEGSDRKQEVIEAVS